MTFRWALRLALIGAVVFGILIAAFHIWHGSQVLRAILYLSSLHIGICETIVTHLFSSKPIAPPLRQSLFFEICLVVGTSFELFMVGLIADTLLWLYRRSQHGRAPDLPAN